MRRHVARKYTDTTQIGKLNQDIRWRAFILVQFHLDSCTYIEVGLL
jgi:hypothetical protein